MHASDRYLLFLADALQVLFGWWIVILALAWSMSRTMEVKRWQGWLRFGVLVGLVGAVVSLGAFAIWVLGMGFSPDEEVRSVLITRSSGPYAWAFWLSLATQLLLIGTLVVARSRASWWLAWAVALIMSLPFERLVIIITSLHRDHLPSGWTMGGVAWSFFVLPVALLASALVMWRSRRGPRNDIQSL